MQIYYDDDDRDDYYFPEGGDEAKSSNSMKDKYGEDTENFKTEFDGGIKMDRGCTDILCLVIFWSFIGAMVYLTSYGFKNGQINKLTAPIDASGNFCGFDDMKDYPKMILTTFHPANIQDIPNSGVCVKECPAEKGTKFVDGENCKDNGSEDYKCADPASTYASKDIFDFCLPTSLDDMSENDKKGYTYFFEQFKKSMSSSPFGDMYKCSTSMYIAIGLSIVWSIVFIYLMSFFAEPLAWCCVFLIQVGLLVGSAYLFFMYTEEQKRVDLLTSDEQNPVSEEQKKELQKEPMKIMIAAIFVGVLALLFLVMVCCGKKDLQRAIDVIDASADYIAENKRVILVPILHFLMTFIFTLIWLGAFLCVVSLNQIKASTIIPQGRDIEWEKKYGYAAAFMFFGFLWITAWIEYSGRFIVITGAVTYYFNNHRDQEEQKGANIMLGVKWAYINHQGSIAIGSFIIALIRFIKYTFYYLAKKLEKSSGENAVVKAAVKCAICVLNCIERICDYLNEAGFCYMAVTGDHFFKAAWNAFLLNLKHGLKFVFANMLAKVFIFIGKIGIVAANLVCFYFLMKSRGDLEEVPLPIYPALVVGVMTYLASSLFLSLFDKAVMALLTSVCIDIDFNNGEPQFGPATFHDNYVKKLGGEDEE